MISPQDKEKQSLAEQPENLSEASLALSTDPDLLSTVALARELGYEPDHIGRLAREDKVKAVRVGKRWFVSRSSLVLYRKFAYEQKKNSALGRIVTLRKAPQALLAPESLTVPSKFFPKIAERIWASRVDLTSSKTGGVGLTLFALFLLGVTFSATAFLGGLQQNYQIAQIDPGVQKESGGIFLAYEDAIQKLENQLVDAEETYKVIVEKYSKLQVVAMPAPALTPRTVSIQAQAPASPDIFLNIYPRLSILEDFLQQSQTKFTAIDQQFRNVPTIPIFTGGGGNQGVTTLNPDTIDSRTVNAGTLTVSGSGAVAGNLAIDGHASASQYFGASLVDCDAAGQTLNWDEATGTFSCGTDAGAGASEIKLEEGGLSVLSTATTLNFDAGKFAISASGSSEVSINLDWASGGPASLSQNETVTGFWTFGASPLGFLVSNSASVSTNFEVSGYASTSAFFGSAFAGISDCSTEGQTLNWNSATGKFSCLTDSSGGASIGGFNGIEIAESDGTFSTHYGSISFETNMFRIGAGSVASQSLIRLDWTSGPASRAADQTITGQWNFTAVGSSQFSGSLGVSKGITANAYQGGGLAECIASGKLLRYSAGQYSCATIADADVPNTITLDNITQITSRAVSDTTGDLAASRVDDGGAAATQALFSGAGSSAGFRAIVDSDIPDTITVSNYLSLGGGTLTGNLIGTGASFSISEFTTYASASKFFGAGLLDCDTAGTSKLLWDATTGRFSCGTDDDVPEVSDFGALVGGTGIDNNSGTLDFDATELSGLTFGDGSQSSLAYVFNLSAGDPTLTARNGGFSITGAASVSSNIEVAGNASASATFGSGLTDCDANGGQLLWNVSTGLFFCETLADADIPDTITVSSYLPLAGGTLSGSLFGTTASLSGTGEALVFKTDTLSTSTGALTINAFTLGGALTGNTQSITGLGQMTVDNLRLDGNTFDSTTGGITIAPNSGLLNITGAASLSTNFETLGYASASKIFGASLTACNSSTQKLIWQTNGTFTCATDLNGSTTLYTDADIPVITIGNTSSLSFERALTGTTNQITITDNGANGSIVLSLPQDVHTTATPTFSGISLGNASVSGNFEATTGKFTTLSRDSGIITIANSASASLNFEIIGYASASSVFGAGLGDCDAGSGNKTLNWSAETGKFSCVDDDNTTVFEVRESSNATGTNVSSASFEAGNFNITFGGAEALIKLDWTNGPASRAANETIAGLWEFRNGASFSAAANNIQVDLNGSGDFIIQDAGTTIFTISDSGVLIFDNITLDSNTLGTSSGGLTIDSSGTLTVADATSFSSTASVSGTLEGAGIIKASTFSGDGTVTFGNSSAITTIAGSGLTISPTTWTAIPTISGLITASGGLTVSGQTSLGTASGSSAFEVGTLKVDSIARDSGPISIANSATASFNFEIVGYASASAYRGGLINLTGTASNSFTGSLSLSKGLTASSYQGGGLTVCSVAGQVLRYSAGQYTCGTLTTSDIDYSAIFQSLDTTLTSLAGFNTNGILTQTGADTFTGRTITGTSNQISVADGNGVSGNPTLSLPNLVVFPGAASISTNLEIMGYTSASAFILPSTTGGVLGDCDADGQTLNWDATTKKFTCGTDTSGSSGAQIEIGASNPDSSLKVSSVSFDAGGFNITDGGGYGVVVLDYANGPASRSADQTISGDWDFTNTGSHSAAGEWNFDSNTFVIDSGTNRIGIGTANLEAALEVVGLASVSDDLRLNGNDIQGSDGSTRITFATTGSNLTFTGTASVSGTFEGAGTIKATTFTGDSGLTVQSGGANTLSLDTGGSSTVSVGGTNATGVTIGRSGQTVTLAGNLGAFTLAGAVTGSGSPNIAGIGSLSVVNASGSEVFEAGTIKANTLTADSGILTISIPSSISQTLENTSGSIKSSIFTGDGAVALLSGGSGNITITPAGGTLTINDGSADQVSITGNASVSATFEATTGKFTTLSRDSGIITIANSASASLNFEIVGYASASKYFGGGLSTCGAGSVVLWNNGLFSCGTDQTGSSTAFNGIEVTNDLGATFTHISSLSFEPNNFNLTNTASSSLVKLDWTNGPASRTANETITGLWRFTGASTQAVLLEATTASVSGTFTFGNGSAAGSINTSDWDISTAGILTGISGITTDGGYTQSGTNTNALTGLTTFSGGASSSTGFEITTGNLGINAGAVTDTRLEIGGTASISGTTTLRGVTYTWPSVDGAGVLNSNGSGTLSWAADDDTPESGDFSNLTGGLAIDNTTGTLDFDPTELINNRTWSDGSSDTSITWTFNLSAGTDPAITFSNNNILFGQNASTALDFESAGRIIAPQSSISIGEFTNYASASKYYGLAFTGLAGTNGCAGTDDTLNYNSTTGVFSCGSDASGAAAGGGFNGIELINSGETFATHYGSVSFDAGHFTLSTGSPTASAAYVRLDWGSGGPASLSENESVTGFWEFRGGASFSGGSNGILVDLDSTGDFIVKDNNTAVLTISDSGVFTFDSITLDGTTLGTSSGGLTIDSAGSLTINDAVIFSSTASISGTFESAGTLKATTFTGDGAVTLSSGTSSALTLDSGDGTVVLATGDNLTVPGTTGLTLSGSGADITFSGGGTNAISSSGTLQLGAVTLAGLVTGNSQDITGVDDLAFANASGSSRFELTSSTSRLGINAGGATDTALEVGGSASISGQFTLGNGSATGAIDTSDWDISTIGALTGISGITTDGGYTQSGTTANTLTGLTTFSGGVSVSTNFELTGDTKLGINAGAVTTTNLEIGGTASISPGTGNIQFNLNNSGDFVIQDAGVTFGAFADTGTFTLDNLVMDGTTLSTNTGTSLTLDANGTGTVILSSDDLQVGGNDIQDSGGASRISFSTLGATGLTNITGSASISANFETTGYASASKTFGAGLTDCDAGVGNMALNWSSETGTFSCTTDDSGGAATFKTEESGLTILSTTSNLNFDGGKFTLTASGSTETIINFDWGSGGPASLSQNETVTGQWTFGNSASISTGFNFEVGGYASSSKTFGSGLTDCDDDKDNQQLQWTASGSNGGRFSCINGFDIQSVQVFTSTGTWTKPANVSTVSVEVWGGGGGGGVATANASDGGGGGGGYSAGLVGVTGNVTVTVGATSAAGGAGNLSSFAAVRTLQGNGGATNSTVTGGAGGTATGGTINISGGAGGSTLAVDGAAGGDGGNGALGGSGGQGGTAVATGGTGQAGQAGSVPGGGGGGGAESAGAASTGAAGTVIVWAYSGVVQGGDLAEWYETEEGVEMGDVVSFGENTFNYLSDTGPRSISILKKAVAGEQIFGAISQRPGLNIGKDLVGQANNPRPIALTGRVPVKVSTRGGAIHKGDLLTSSSVPGVAVRTDKASQIIGSAMEDYDASPDDIGSILVYINTGYSNGARMKRVLQQQGVNMDEIPYEVDIGRIILSQMMHDKKNISKETELSEIFTDRVVAGLEIISPRVITDTLVANILEPVERDLTLKLNNDGKFIITAISSGSLSTTLNDSGSLASDSAEPVITFDAGGNAFFAGQLTANTINAEKISGLEIITKQLSVLSGEVASISATQENEDILKAGNFGTLRANQALVAGTLNIQGSSSFDGILFATKIIADDISSPVIDSLDSRIFSLASQSDQLASASSDISLRVSGLEQFKDNLQNILGADGGLTVDGFVMLSGGLLVNQVSALSDALSLMSDTLFFGRPFFNSDMGGFAIIPAGARSVRVTFEREYLEQPVVNVSIAFERASDSADLEDTIFAEDIRYLVSHKETTGFDIILNTPTLHDMPFNWIALAIRNPRTIIGTPVPTPIIIENQYVPEPDGTSTETAPSEEEVSEIGEEPLGVPPGGETEGKIIAPVPEEPPPVFESVPESEPVIESNPEPTVPEPVPDSPPPVLESNPEPIQPAPVTENVTESI